MNTPNVNAMSESESWICHQLLGLVIVQIGVDLCSGFFTYWAMDCCVGLPQKAKKTLQFCMI